MLKQTVSIAGKEVGASNPPYVIAEIGSNHDQSKDKAFRMIDLAAEAGAHAAKFQLFQADKMYPAGTKMHDIFRSIQLDSGWLTDLAARCDEAGIHFMASPFDEQSADKLEAAGVPAYKVASSETAKPGLLSHIASFGKPVIISTGMCDLVDIHDAVQICRRAGNENVILLQCGAMYPIPPEHVHLRVMDTFASLYGCPVGFSDHTTGMAAAVAAVGRGASVIEKHITLDRNSDGPDHFFAMQPEELVTYVAMINEAHTCLGSAEKCMLPWERAKSRREGLYAARDIRKGEVLQPADILIQRPAGDIRKRHFLTLVGSSVRKDIAQGEGFSWEGLNITDS